LTEVSVPLEALQPLWTSMNRKSWGRKLHSSSSAEDLLQVLASLDGAIKIEYLSSNFETTGELLYSSNEKGRSWSLIYVAIVNMLQKKLETQKNKESENFI
ncbi:hypothetical protein ABKV19_025743, partial [Rosa sericea]